MSFRSNLQTKSMYIVVTTFVLFVAGGAAYSAVRTPIYEASTKVAVRQPTERPGSEARDASSRALTEAEVIGSDQVLDLASSKLKISGKDELKRSLSTEVVGGTDVLEIKVRRPVAQQAADWANAVAESYVEFRRTSMVDNATATSEVISRAMQADSTKLEQLRDRIKSSPSDADALKSEERRLAASVRNLQTQLLGLMDSEALRRGGATIIDAAERPSDPSEPDWLRNLGLAGAAGIGTGALLSLAGGRPRAFRTKRRVLSDQSVRNADLRDSGPGAVSHLESRLIKLEQELTTGLSQITGSLKTSGAQGGAASQEPGNRLGTRLDGDGPALTARLHGVLAQLSSQLASQQDGVSAALDHLRRGIVDEIREDRAHMTEKMAQEDHELLQRFSGFAQNVGQALENLRDEALAKISTTHDRIAGLQESLESKMEVEAKAFSGQVSGVLNQLAAQSQLVETRVSQAVGQLHSSLVQKSDINHAELVQRVATLDVEVSQRLDQVALRLSEALAGLRTEVSDKLDASEKAIARMLESSENGRKIESSEVSRRLSGVSRELSSHLEALESRLLSSAEAMKRKLEQGARAELTQLAEGLSEIDEDAADRVTKLSASIKRSLSDLKGRLSEELSNQQLDLSSRFESLEAKVAQSASGANKRLTGRVKNMEESVSEIASQLKKRSRETKRAAVVPLSAASPLKAKSKATSKPGSASGKKSSKSGTTEKAKAASKSKR